ncbi:lariat debranching enzyme [Haplosporangium sp. Z 27]|nr:lariat debranching enzyme [Haplosporangium sp. Z 27]
MRIAVEGCCHGQLDDIYREIELREKRYNYKIDLLLICGDFHSIRNEADLDTIACPRKYLHLGTFYKYYSGELNVPVPTVFIGGNHESSNYLWELYHGGWVCPNIYFLGWGGVINVGGMRIGGMTGIYKSQHYQTGHFEVTPYNDNHKRSVYHIRKYDVYKMLQVKEPLDVFLSHDWPLGIERYGNLQQLLKAKSYFTSEVNNNTLGSPPFEQVLTSLRPAYWFSAHLHVRYAAQVEWDTTIQSGEGSSQQQQEQQQSHLPGQVTAKAFNNPDEGASKDIETTTVELVKNPDEINIDLDDEDEDLAHLEAAHGGVIEPKLDAEQTTTSGVVTSNPEEIQIELDDDDEDDTPEPIKPQLSSSSRQEQPVHTPTGSSTSSLPKPHPTCTKFLALDKCGPGRKFLEVIDFPEINEPIEFKYDEEWLAIVRTLDPFLSLEHKQRNPLVGKKLEHALRVNREWVKNNITNTRGLAIPLNFQPTTPAHDPVQTMGQQQRRDSTLPHLNPQTVEFSAMLQIKNRINEHGRTA